jgi:hypothetical protein
MQSEFQAKQPSYFNFKGSGQADTALFPASLTQNSEQVRG